MRDRLVRTAMVELEPPAEERNSDQGDYTSLALAARSDFGVYVSGNVTRAARRLDIPDASVDMHFSPSRQWCAVLPGRLVCSQRQLPQQKVAVGSRTKSARRRIVPSLLAAAKHQHTDGTATVGVQLRLRLDERHDTRFEAYYTSVEDCTPDPAQLVIKWMSARTQDTHAMVNR